MKEKTTQKKRGKNFSPALTEDSTTTVQKFDFDLSFQKTLIKKSIENSEWYSFIRERIVPENYDLPELVFIAKTVDEFFLKNEYTPDYKVIESILKKNLNRDIFNSTHSALLEIQQIKVKDSGTYKYSEELATRFSSVQEWKQFIINSAEFIDSGNIEEVEKLHEELVTKKEAVKLNSSSKILDIFDISNVEIRYENIITDKVPTLFKIVDEKLKGGLSKGELGYILAPPYTGKTASLIQLGTNAVFAGKNVLHVTVELSKPQTAIRYDMCLTGTTFEDIVADKKAFKKKLESFKRLYKGNLFIEEFPARSLSVQNLKSFIKTVEKVNKIEIDLVILDYADELKRPNWENTSYAVGDVVSRLRGMAQDLHKAVWSATQTNRAGFSKATLDMDDVADSWDKAKVVDVMIALCQSEEEKIKEKMRWIILKNRSNKRFSKPIQMSTNFNIMRFKEI